jgi:hypothetical protein
MRLGELAACGGVAGPVVFTAAWVVSSLRQAGYPAAGIQLSGLAAEDARDPQIMMAVVVLGVCTIAFGAALRQVAGHRTAGPWLVMVAGAAAVAAGPFRRDHMLLTGPGFAGESWHNQVHDVVSGLAYAAMLTAPLALARQFRTDPQQAMIARPAARVAWISASRPGSGARVALRAARRLPAISAGHVLHCPHFEGFRRTPHTRANQSRPGSMARSSRVTAKHE